MIFPDDSANLIVPFQCGPRLQVVEMMDFLTRELTAPTNKIWASLVCQRTDFDVQVNEDNGGGDQAK